jgi:hypothetical protein
MKSIDELAVKLKGNVTGIMLYFKGKIWYKSDRGK